MLRPAKIKTATIRIPKRFYDDHVERDLPAPGVLKETKAHYYIDALSRDLPELLDDAEHYAIEYPHMAEHVFGIGRSAVATARAIRKYLDDA